MKLNSYQQEILKKFKSSDSSLSIKALAGTGKTTTLITLIQENKGSFVALAYSKATAETLKSKLPLQSNNIKTSYSIGLSILKNNYPDVKVDANKFDKIYRKIKKSDLYFKCTGNLYPEYDSILKSEAQMAYKHCLLNLTLDASWLLLNLNKDEKNFVCELIPRIHKESIKNKNMKTISFEEMISLPYFLDIPSHIRVNTVFIDESQDLSKAQLDIVKRLNPNRVISVGDPNQAIMGFAGANFNSFFDIENHYHALRLPLPVNYRCSIAVIENAKQLQPELQYHENAPKGSVNKIDKTELYSVLDKYDKVMILCRTNMPLIRLSLSLVDMGYKLHHKRGKSLEFLKGIVNRGKKQYSWKMKRVFFNDLKEDAIECKNPLQYDAADLLEWLSQDSKSWNNLQNKLKSLFTNDRENANIVLSSIHSAKGDEHENVVLWGDNLIPHKLCITQQELQQEQNLLYVASTRAKVNLFKVSL